MVVSAICVCWMEISDRASEKVLGDRLSDVDRVVLSRSCNGDNALGGASGAANGAGTNAVSLDDVAFVAGRGVSTPACGNVMVISGDPRHVGHSRRVCVVSRRFQHSS